MVPVWMTLTVLVFPYQTIWQYSDETPYMGKNQDFQPIRRFGDDVFLFPFDWHLVYGFALTY